jgi:hypothetical protein
MTPEQWAKNLEARGYAFCGTHADTTKDPNYRLQIGDRVRKQNQHFGYTTGTGTIEAIYYKERSAWSQKYKSDDVELIIKNDDGTYSFVANYHVAKVESRA